MRTIAIPSKAENIIIDAAQNRKKIATHLADASEYETNSAFHLKNGNHENAAFYAILAQESVRLASQVKIEDIKLHALYN
jgi:hypothetical protein